MNKKYYAYTLLSLALQQTQAQQKPSIDHSVYDAWKSIGNSTISPSGKYIFYTINPQEGDSYSEWKDNKNNLIFKRDRAVAPKINQSEQFIISTIKPFFKDTRAAKIKKKKADEMPKDSLSLFDLNKRKEVNLGEIKSYKTAEQFQKYLAYSQDLEPRILAPADTTKKKTKPKKEAVLIIRDIHSGDTTQLWKVEQYYFDRNEKYLVYNRKSTEKDSTGTNGLYLFDLLKKSSKKISSGKGDYKAITFDDKSSQLIFLADKSPEKATIKDYKIYYYSDKQDSAKVIINSNTNNIPPKWNISGNANLAFSENGKTFTLGLAPIPAVKDTTLVDFENAKVDIWHWKDDYLMTQQLVNLKRDQSKSYEAIYHLDENKLIPLVDESFNRVSTTETANEEWVLATSSTLEEKIASQWQYGQAQDVYLISTLTAKRVLIKSNWFGQAYLSPNAQDIILFDQKDGGWKNYNIATEKEINLTQSISTSFVDERNDMPAPASAYGLAAWSEDNKGVYIYDRYDIWYFSLDGKSTENITKQFGRNQKITLRFIQAKQREWRKNTFKIYSKSTILLSSFNETNKENGVFKLNLAKNNHLEQIIQDKFTFKGLSTDNKGEYYIYSKENYENSPNIYLSKAFKAETQLTDINPQQSKYNWGTAELIKWTTPNGYTAEGILYKPENFDPNKKYPIIAYFYETLTDGLYNYHAPAPTPSRLMISYFVSNEYLVFAPDIKYQTGYPGKAAEEYINSGMQYLAQNNWVDAKKMAIQGQSWGGYQVAHLITRTDMYAAAWTGAPVVNMTSAYGGIRWQTGMSRQFQYEKTQSRIGATLWENRDLYIENSPLFFMDKVNTPVAIMHNDNDGAVPWYQGIEMFTALRRLQKPVWLLNYNGDEHNLTLRQNRKDIQIRQSQFFDHFLKDKPAAEWLKNGVKAKEKGTNWGFDIKN